MQIEVVLVASQKLWQPIAAPSVDLCVRRWRRSKDTHYETFIAETGGGKFEGLATHI